MHVLDGPLEKQFNNKGLHLRAWKKYWFFLFNDLLMYTTVPSAKGKCKVKYQLPLVSMEVKEADSGSKKKFGFEILSNVKSFFLAASSPAERDKWIQALRDHIELSQQRRSTLKLVDPPPDQPALNPSRSRSSSRSQSFMSSPGKDKGSDGGKPAMKRSSSSGFRSSISLTARSPPPKSSPTAKAAPSKGTPLSLIDSQPPPIDVSKTPAPPSRSSKSPPPPRPNTGYPPAPSGHGHPPPRPGVPPGVPARPMPGMKSPPPGRGATSQDLLDAAEETTRL
eukprot:g1529.t1